MGKPKVEPKSKSTDERVIEVMQIMTQLKDLGVTRNTCPSLDDFHIVVNRFIKEGASEKGEIKLDGLNRVLHYKLVGSAGIESSSYLEYDESV
jgi:hypothetical protein